MTVQPQNNNLNFLIDPTFTNVNRLFVLTFTRTNIRNSRNSFSHYYVPEAEIKDFNVLIDDKSFFDLSVEKKEEDYEKIKNASNSNDYTAGNLLDFAYFKKHYKLFSIDLSKQNNLKEPQQINFIGKLSNILGATIFFIIEKSEETNFNFSQN